MPAALRPLKIKTTTSTTTLKMMRAVNHGLEDDAMGFFCSAGTEMKRTHVILCFTSTTRNESLEKEGEKKKEKKEKKSKARKLLPKNSQ